MTTNKKLINLFLTVVMAFVLININNNARAEEIEFSAKEVNEKYIEWLNLPDEEKEKTIEPFTYEKNIKETFKNVYRSKLNLVGSNLGSYYNLRDNIFLKIKDQKNTMQCWAFSATTQLESYMAKIENKIMEFSPRHIEYSTAKTFANGVTNPEGYNREVNGRGNALMAYSYMTSGRGPVLEADMPFVDTTAKIELSEIQNKTIQCQLEEYVIFPQIYKEKNGSSITYTNGQTGSNRVVYTNAQINSFRNMVKEHIVKYGGVSTTMASAHSEFYSNPTNYLLSVAYNCDDPSITVDHQVTIIGWDDNYPISNFNSNHRPSNPGAWLVQNSYGDVFNNGTLYISYEDCLIENYITGIVKLSEVDYDHLYQHDILGTSGSITLGDYTKAYAANVFDKSDKTENLSEIGITLDTESCSSFEIYVNPKGKELNTSSLQKVKTVTNVTSDYVTVKIDPPIPLTGESFAVAVKYISNGNDTVYIPIESKNAYQYSRIHNTATSSAGESFFSGDGENWLDAYDAEITGLSNINTCIKAFTLNDKISPEIEVAYSSVSPTNKDVTVTITSNEKIQGVKGWTLSSDKKKLTKTYKSNGNEQVTIYDLENNKTTVSVAVTTIDRVLPIIEVNYSTKNFTNKNVLVTITSNEELKSLIGWTLSPDKKKLTKTYSQNAKESLTISDLAGNTQKGNIAITNIDKELPVIMNVKNNAKYKSAISPLAKDTNLEEVELYKSSSKVKGYKNGDTIKDLGNYEIIAKDKAGNTTKMKFSIVKRNTRRYQ